MIDVPPAYRLYIVQAEQGARQRFPAPGKASDPYAPGHAWIHFMTILSALDKAARYSFKVGDIVYTDNSGACFYRVTKRTKCLVTLQRIQSETVEYSDGGYGQSGYDVPVNIAASEDTQFVVTNDRYYTVRTRIKTDEEGNEEAFIDGNWYQHVLPYDGQPKPYDTYR